MLAHRYVSTQVDHWSEKSEIRNESGNIYGTDEKSGKGQGNVLVLVEFRYSDLLLVLIKIVGT